MPYTLTVSIDDGTLRNHLDRLQSTFGQQVLEDLLKLSGGQVGVAMESVFQEYPDKKKIPLPLFYTRTRADGTTYKSKFKSKKQQALVILLGKKGKIPYRRTGNLGRSYQSTVIVSNRTVSIIVGSPLAYAEYVVGDKQSHFLGMLGWVSETDKLNQAEPALTKLYELTLQKNIDVIDKRYGGK